MKTEEEVRQAIEDRQIATIKLRRKGDFEEDSLGLSGTYEMIVTYRCEVCKTISKESQYHQRTDEFLCPACYEIRLSETECVHTTNKEDNDDI